MRYMHVCVSVCLRGKQRSTTGDSDGVDVKFPQSYYQVTKVQLEKLCLCDLHRAVGGTLEELLS